MMDIRSLNHRSRRLSGGGEVIVLDTGATITPEAEAMLQALHSRSIGGIKSHLEVLIEKGASKFMSTFYVGYGHKSIGDCGTATIFIEGVSMLAAKAIQDWPLYSGQEASTRYIDFSKQNFLNPAGKKRGEVIQENWRKFYLAGLEEMVTDLKRRYPIKEGEKESVYEKAIRARAFDTMRGFLPAGAVTNLAWHSNLRQIADKINLLRHHPLTEVQEIAHKIEEAVNESFPSSFSTTRYEKTEKYNKDFVENYSYFETKKKIPEFKIINDSISKKELIKYKDLLKSRPPKTELPRFLGDLGSITFEFLLDFGSFRDLQRHRSIYQRMPLLTREHGFNPWYLSELTPSLRKKAENFLIGQTKLIKSLKLSKELEQYYNAMGYNLPNRITGGLPALAYIAELRGTRFVHPTLRKHAIKIGQELTKRFKKEGLMIHLDADPDRFDSTRGKHDIVKVN